MYRRTQRSTRTGTLVPYTTLCRSGEELFRGLPGQPGGMGAQRGDQIGAGLFGGAARRVEGHVGAGIEGLALGEDALEVGHGFRLARHRAHVALGDDAAHVFFRPRSEEHTSELPSLMRLSYAVFCF